MSYRTIDENYYRCATCGPLGLQLALQYDSTNGNYRLIEKTALGIGSAVFYQNGVYYSDAIRDPNLFTSGDPNKITSAGIDLSKRIRTSVYNSYQTLGGLNKGNVINDSAKPGNQALTPGVTNSVPGANPGPASSLPGLSNPPGQGNIFDVISPGLPDPGPFETIPVPWKKLLKYPIDLLETRQDTLRVTQIEYQSPNKDIFETNITDILTKGLVRGSVNKSIRGTVILPIPNNASDSNNVAWGEDNMDALTTAATALAVQKPGVLGGGLLGAAGLSGLLSALNMPGASGLAANAPPAAIRAYLLTQASNNAAVKAALQSYILSKYQFEVSPESILSRGLGIVPNSNLQLLFNNVTLRNFNFSYMMSPRSEEEAKEVNMILRFFKQGMAAKKGAAGTTLFLKTPNVFKLEYKSGNKEIKGMNKFKICALTGFSVNYTPNGQWAAYDEGQPTSVVMTMGFKELEPVYENDYKTTSNVPFDAPPVNADEIGY